jgi:hypothetical protein
MPRKTTEPTVSAEDAIGDDTRERIPFAGLLAERPNLRNEQHTHAEWQELLDAYLNPSEDPDAG